MIKHSGKIRLMYGGNISSTVSSCGEYSLRSDYVAFSGEEVTCSECLNIINCSHDWKHTFTGVHGSDKGDDYYECRICLYTIQIYGPINEVMERIIPRIFERCSKQQAEAIIFKGFKSI